MNAFKGTPGPWYHGSHPMNCDVVYAARYEERVAECNGADEHEAEANARLIAASPELLEALHVVSECGDPCKVILYDEEGIEGWRWTHPDGREWEETGEWCEDPPLHPVARAAIAKATGEQP